MTPIECILLLAVVGLAAQVVILQRHYSTRLADQSIIIGYLFELVAADNVNSEKLDQIRDKIFSSSQ